MPSLKALHAAILCALTIVSAAVAPFEAHSEPSVRATCGTDAPLAVQFFRAFSSSQGDHFYTTNAAEMNAAVANDGYAFEGVAGRIYSTTVDNTVVPFYRAYNPHVGDHFYTTNAAELETAITNDGYNDEGFIYPDELCGAQPLYRLYSPGITDHFYTLSEAEVASAEQGGYIYEGIPGYIFTA